MADDIAAHGARRYTQQQYAAAMRHVVTPTELRHVAYSMLATAKGAFVTPEGESFAVDLANQRAAAEWVVIHTKGRPGTAAPSVDPLELPKVTDAASAIAAYQAVTEAVSKGECCADSAAVYRALIGDSVRVYALDRGQNPDGPTMPYQIHLHPNIPAPRGDV